LLQEYQGKAYKTLFEPFLYSQDQFLVHQSGDKPVIFLILEGETCFGRIFFFLNGNEAKSPGKAPFGSWEMAPDLPLDVLAQATTEINRILKERGIERITITCPPGVYSYDNNLSLSSALTGNGFQLMNWEINHHLDFKRDFISQLHPMERRKLKKGLDCSFEFRERSQGDLELVYDFIQICREERDQGLSLKLDDLLKLLDDFPHNYKLFSVEEKGELAAASISVVVNKNILYNFYPAAASKFKSFSPLVFLSGELVKYGLASGFKVIDLGTSMIDNKPNFSLIRFKERIGGDPYPKVHFQSAVELTNILNGISS